MDTLITDYRAVFAKAFADGDTEKTRQDVADLRKRAAALVTTPATRAAFYRGLYPADFARS